MMKVEPVTVEPPRWPNLAPHGPSRLRPRLHPRRVGDLPALLVVWLADISETAKFVLGLTHGVGFLSLCGVIWVACLRGALAWPILAAAALLTPFGSSVAIEWSRWRSRHRHAAASR